jgi:hypothetical protein
MNLIPLVGTDEVTFGTPEEILIKLLKPTMPTYDDPPKFQEGRTLRYGKESYNLDTDRRLIKINIFLSGKDPYPRKSIFLWGTDIAEFSSHQLLDFVRLKRSEEKVTEKEHSGGDSAKKVMEEKYQDDEWDIEVLDYGIVIRDIDDGYWDIEVPECGIKIECLGVEVEKITIRAVGEIPQQDN